MDVPGTLSKVQSIAQQAMAISNLGVAVISSGIGVYNQIIGILRTNGYNGDTSALDELAMDIERRRQLAAKEKNATE